MVNISSGPDFYFFFLLIGASLMSFVISHIVYLQSIRT